jgi:hypothetical protein
MPGSTRALLCFALVSCGGGRASSDPLALPCSGSPPPSAQPFGVGHTRVLAGTYTLVEVDTLSPARGQQRKRIHLYVPDSSYAASEHERRTGNILLGWQLDATDSEARGDAGSRDPDYPGIRLFEGNRLMIGGVAVLDGTGDLLLIEQWSPDGFWGTWRLSTGFEIMIDTGSGQIIPNPGGYFCAHRDPLARGA